MFLLVVGDFDVDTLGHIAENYDLTIPNLQKLGMANLKALRGIAPVEFADVPDGSLFGTYKVENQVIWDAIKANKFKGFSLEGVFSIKQDSEEETYRDLIKSIKKIKRVS